MDTLNNQKDRIYRYGSLLPKEKSLISSQSNLTSVHRIIHFFSLQNLPCIAAVNSKR